MAAYSHSSGPPAASAAAGDHHIKPSGRFARPKDGPVFSPPQLPYSYTNHPAFTYSMKHTQSYSSSSEEVPSPHPLSLNHSPLSTWSYSSNSTALSIRSNGNNIPDSSSLYTPPTSSEDVPLAAFIPPYANNPTTRAGSSSSIYDALSHPPILPPKSSQRPTSWNNRDVLKINTTTATAATSLQPKDEEVQEESRDQLSNLRSIPLSPRRQAYMSPSSQSDDSIMNTINSLPPIQVETDVKTPRRKSFFTFGRASSSSSSDNPNSLNGVSKNADSKLKNVRDIPNNALATRSSTDLKHDTNNQEQSADRTPRHSLDGSMEAYPASSILFSPTSPKDSADFNLEQEQDRRSSRRSSSSRNFLPSLGRRSKSSTRSPPPPPPLSTSPPSGRILSADDAKMHSKKGSSSLNPYENSKKGGVANKKASNGMVFALNEEWVVLPQDQNVNTFIQQQAEANNARVSPQFSPVTTATTTTVSDTSRNPATPLSSNTTHKTPSPLKSRHKVLQNWKTPSSISASTSPPQSLSSSPHAVLTPPVMNEGSNAGTNSGSTSKPSSRENVKSPPFFLRGRRKASNSKRDSKAISSNDSPLTSPLSPPPLLSNIGELENANTTKAAVAHWPAENHVFGAAQAVIGNATIGPHISAIRGSPAHPGPGSIRASIVSPAFTINHTANGSITKANDGKDNGERVLSPVSRSETPSSSSIGRDDVFGTPNAPTPKDPRQRVYDILAAPQSRESSLYTFSSGTTTPVQLRKQGKGKPRFEDALLNHPKTILANVLDHLSYRTFKRLTHVSPKLYRATFSSNDKSDFAEVVRQRYLASYGYRPLPLHIRLPVQFTLKDLNAFNNGIEFSLAEYSIFATEHKRTPLEQPTTKMFRESTRAFNKLVFRLQYQNNLPSLPANMLFLPLAKPYWKDYIKMDQVQVFKHGRCALLRVWVPCENSWMSDEEVLEVEREVHRSGVWNLLRKGDLVRNIALGDIANEGMCILHGPVLLRILSF